MHIFSKKKYNVDFLVQIRPKHLVYSRTTSRSDVSRPKCTKFRARCARTPHKCQNFPLATLAVASNTTKSLEIVLAPLARAHTTEFTLILLYQSPEQLPNDQPVQIPCPRHTNWVPNAYCFALCFHMVDAFTSS